MAPPNPLPDGHAWVPNPGKSPADGSPRTHFVCSKCSHRATVVEPGDLNLPAGASWTSSRGSLFIFARKDDETHEQTRDRVSSADCNTFIVMGVLES